MIRNTNSEAILSIDGVVPPAMLRPPMNLLTRTVERMLGLSQLRTIYDDASAEGSHNFPSGVLRQMNTGYLLSEQDRGRIPATGPVIVVANHPFGAIEGLILLELLRSVRPDVKVMANYLLGRIPELREHFILVDPFDRPESARENIGALREAIRWVKDDGLLAIFPAGEVSSFSMRDGCTTDPEWCASLAGIVRATEAMVLPLYFEGCNSLTFRALGMIHPRLRTAMLGREMVNKRDRNIVISIGRPVPFSRLQRFAGNRDMVEYLRARTYNLAYRSVAPEHEAAPQRQQISVVLADATETLQREVESLTQSELLIESGDLQVWCAPAERIPRVLREIGRLREVTFRAVGEGTGQAIDLDRFDAHYQHLFVWNRATQEVVGAYRLGQVDTIAPRLGIGGLYTSTLFRYKEAAVIKLGAGLEMGRAFVRPEYQRNHSPLMLLWKGIGQYVARNPHYSILFGPISISNDYNPTSRQMMVRFLAENRLMPELARLVQPRSPFRGATRLESSAMLLKDIEDVAHSVSDIEHDDKGVPVLLRQYLKLGAKVLSFNVDASFGNVIDGLVVVDLLGVEQGILERYMGRDEARHFIAHHTASQEKEPGHRTVAEPRPAFAA